MSSDSVLSVRDLVTEGDGLRARLSVNGRERAIAYRLDGIQPTQGVEALAVALLPLAMSRGWSLELPGGLSPRLRDGLDSAQAILAGWWEDWDRVELRTEEPGDPRPAPEGGTACFFTGGVDSFYSVLTEQERLDAVIFVHGFDVPLGDLSRRNRIAGSLREAADELGLELIEVETNIKDLAWRGCKWGFHAHGAALASVALLTGSRFGEVLIPASHTYRDLYPWGSHALLDPLWSTEAVRVVHHGALGRTRKVAVLAESQPAMRHLRCCHEAHDGGLNCGHCEKCLRTMASLRIVEALDRCATLPDELRLREIRRMPVLGRGWATLIRDLVAEAEGAGDHRLARALRRTLRVGPWRVRALKARRSLGARSRRGRRRLRGRLRRAARRARRPGRGQSGRPRGDERAAPGAAIRPVVLPDDREAMLAVLEPEGLHRIPSPEMADFDVGNWLVAERDGAIVAVAGFRLERTADGTIGRNLLLAVREEHRGRGIGRALVDRRLRLMLDAGATKVVTNTDRPDLIAWLERDYGYRRIGEVQKLHPFGRADVDRWTTLEAPMARATAGLDS